MNNLKNILAFVAVLTLTFSTAFSQTENEANTIEKSASNWKIDGNGSLMMNQAYFEHWAKGGETSIATNAYFSVNANYKNNEHEWNNSLNIGYGLMKSEEYDYYKKIEDKVDFTSKYGYGVWEKVNVSALLNFKTQMTDGFAYPDDSTAISKLFAPAYLNASIGLDYKPIEGLSIFLTPVSGRLIFVMDDDLADLGKYIPSPAKYDSLGNKIEDGEKIRFEFGANVVIQYEKEIMKNIMVKSKLNLFNNYTDSNEDNRAHIDVDWDNTINFKVNDYISANISCRMVYDHDIMIPLYKDIDGVKTQYRTGRRLQIKEFLGIGLSYKF